VGTATRSTVCVRRSTRSISVSFSAPAIHMHHFSKPLLSASTDYCHWRGCPDSSMTGPLCEHIRYHISDWYEYISRPSRGRPQPKLAKRAYDDYHPYCAYPLLHMPRRCWSPTTKTEAVVQGTTHSVRMYGMTCATQCQSTE
jgi:hypothetical protein